MQKIFLSILLVLSAGCAVKAQAAAQPLQRKDMDSIAQYIISHQLPEYLINGNGAIWTFEDKMKVIPYFAHIAARGILHSDHPDKYSIARRWMNWYIAHLDADGRASNYYYIMNGTIENHNGPDDIDAQDSDPALFWVLAGEYYKDTADMSFFTANVKGKMETAAKFVVTKLMAGDDLSDAKVNYNIKYTMDNSELYAGFMSLAAIERDVYKDEARYKEYSGRAAKIKTAVMQRLYSDSTKLYRQDIGVDTDPQKWYGGIAAALWPQLWGVEAYKSSRSKNQRKVLDKYFNAKNKKDWTTRQFLDNKVDDYPWASVGYLYTMAGDKKKGQKQLSYIVPLFKYHHTPPCTIAEAGWVLMHLDTLFPK